MIHKMRQFISYFALRFMKGVQVQLTCFMSSVYITEDRIIEKGIVQVCLGPKELFICNRCLYHGGAVVDWCLNYGGASM